MKINRCPNCGGRLVADILESEVRVRCNACGQELGTFDRADKPIVIADNELYPLSADGWDKTCPRCGTPNPELRQRRWRPYEWYVMCPHCEFGDEYRYATPAEAKSAWEHRTYDIWSETVNE